jgi:release factor glutamine methyltransferase
VTATAQARSWTVRDVLDWTRERFQRAGLATARLDAEVLLALVLGCARIDLYASALERPLDAGERDRFRDLVRRRLDHEPVAYISGTREFWSLSLRVDRRVLIPRPETETLVEQALARLPADGPAVVCDVGTGSGAIALALLSERPLLRAVATDVSAGALALAAANAAALHDAAAPLAARLELRAGDLFATLGDGERFDLIVSNPPYVPAAELPALMADVRDHEPHVALDGGADGLDVVRRLVAGAPAHLVPGGALLVEIGAGQLAAAAALATPGGPFLPALPVRDHAGIDRVVVFALPPAPPASAVGVETGAENGTGTGTGTGAGA